MADKEVASSKRAKISEAQQYMLLAVLGAAVVLGVGISLTMRFVKQIAFNSNVIAVEEQSIAAYSKVIKATGVCKSPKGEIYSDRELADCDPDSIEVSEIPNTLRYNVLVNLASNEALNSVPKEDNNSCINPDTGKAYTYKQLNRIYSNAVGSEALTAASQLIKSCSALRVIPDALPAFKNEEALLASLNKIFIVSDWEPESLSPSGTITVSDLGTGLNTISVDLLVEANSATVLKVMNNIERSIREFDITSATIEWGSDNSLLFNAEANAYYMDESSVAESSETISPDTDTSSSSTLPVEEAE